MNVVRNLGFRERWPGDVFHDLANSGRPRLGPGRVVFSRLSPLPLSEHQVEATFETRFAELEHMIKQQESSVEDHEVLDLKFNSLFVIDSLNAFTGHLLTRSQLYQLFTLFRTKRIPLIVTLEQPETMYPGGALEHFSS